MHQSTRTAAIMTISDTRRPDDDASGQRLMDLLSSGGFEVIERLIVNDDPQNIRDTLLALTARGHVSLIITTGGTGLGPRDNTPEATRDVIEREAPGLSEAMRRETAAKTPMAMLSRGIAGIRGRTLIINLPGSPRAVEECFEVIQPVLGHTIDLIRGRTSHPASEDSTD